MIPLADGLTPDDPRYGSRVPATGRHRERDASNFGFNRSGSPTEGSVFRMVLHWGRTGWTADVLPGGQSALTDSPYFADQAASWLGNEAWPLRFTVSEVVAGGSAREVLLPASGDTCGQQFD